MVVSRATANVTKNRVWGTNRGADRRASTSGSLPPPSFVVRCHGRSLAQDAWAADCTPADDGGIPDDAADACISERDGLRNVILVCAAWLGWAILGFGLAWGFAARIAERDPNGVRGAGGAPCSGCGGYSAIEMRRMLQQSATRSSV